MGALSPLHLIIILVIALIVVGPGKLPETGAALGRTIREFRKATQGALDEPSSASPSAAAAPAAPEPPDVPPSAAS